MSFTYAQLRAEYAELWRTMSINASRKGVVDGIAKKSLANKSKYLAVSEKTGVPWQFIAAAHSLESSQSFTRHLHNGDPLTKRTVQVPADRPRAGSPPFSWDESAIDALMMPPHSLHLVKEWPIERVLFELERYNGWGYRTWHKTTLSPYLWSFTNHYRKGKYVADGKWDSNAVSSQCGAAAILKAIYDSESVTVAPSAPEPGPVAAPVPASPTSEAKMTKRLNVLAFGGLGGAKHSAGLQTIMMRLAEFHGKGKPIDYMPQMQDYASWKSWGDAVSHYTDDTVLIGHSYGVAAMFGLVRRLGVYGPKIPLCIALDPSQYTAFSWALWGSGGNTVPNRVERATNYYQTGGWIGRQLLYRQDGGQAGIANFSRSGTTHKKIDDDPKVQFEVVEEIKKLF